MRECSIYTPGKGFVRIVYNELFIEDKNKLNEILCWFSDLAILLKVKHISIPPQTTWESTKEMAKRLGFEVRE